MTPRTVIAQMARTIGRELQNGARPSESAWAAGTMLADAGATKEIAACLFAAKYGQPGFLPWRLWWIACLRPSHGF